MPNLIEVLLLGIVQGLTEWLPISSSGHLTLIQLALGIRASLLFNLLLHLGTLSVVVVKFKDDIFQIVRDISRGNMDSEAARRGRFVVSGSIPTAFIGFAFYEFFRESFEDPLVIATAFAMSGLALHLSSKPSRKKPRGLKLTDSILLGVAQGISIFPGISRSGLTISTGILIGLDKEEAYKYSFLLSIPAVLGAAIFEAARQPPVQIDWYVNAFGFIAAIIVGYASLTVLWEAVRRNQLHNFKYYCFSASCLIVALSVTEIL